MKLDFKTIALGLSLLVNALGGTGTIDPIVGGPAPCPVCPVCAPR